MTTKKGVVRKEVEKSGLDFAVLQILVSVFRLIESQFQ
jgi:hypothetical protein